MQIELNSTSDFTTRRIIYHLTIDGMNYEYIEHENERGKVIDHELFSASGEFVYDDALETAIQEYLDQKL